MKIFSDMQQLVQNLWRSILRIFSPSDDDYPETGVQPFEGDVFEDK